MKETTEKIIEGLQKPTWTVDNPPSVLSELLDGYVAEAKRLVDTLNAFDGSGIPRSDAYDAFALLRKIAKREAV